MKLIFHQPEQLQSLEIMLATKTYADIWQQDSQRIIQAFKQYTGLDFQQDEIQVIVHEGQSMSGMDGKPMRLNALNMSLNEKRNALIHELAHRLLFGNGLYAPESEGANGDETRVFLFQGDILRDVYGPDVYNFWADINGAIHSEDHRKIISPILKLSKAERREKINQFLKADSASNP